ncbi:monocarboxylate transporter 14 isoform X2 [Agrilus planipennis]|uniref:Monocarboxylate transporter 14 isoform X2 n=1 Tax=Agrilus planipennis TaxID=224129 RepID=A0A1W4X5Q0_AGRPL|nr:monocarboxylate transporter 14 isoform X2 [Agrilus planipennis]
MPNTFLNTKKNESRLIMAPPNGVPPGNGTVYTPLSESPPMNSDSTEVPSGTRTTTISVIDTSKQEEEPATSNSDCEDEYVVVPPDGGWGWVVVFGSFMCNMIVDGIVFSFSTFLPHIEKEFNASKSDVSLVGSLLAGCYLIVGPFASALANRYGFRAVAVIGTFIATLAFVLSHFAPNVQVLWLTYGLLGGIGFGLIYVPAVITAGFYFEKWRAIATGIGVCGSGIGAFVMTPFSNYLIQEMGWRNALLAEAAIIFSCIAFGLLFRPVKPTKLTDIRLEERPPKIVTTLVTNDSSSTKYKLASIESINKSHSAIPQMLGVNNNANYPTAAEILKNPDVFHVVGEKGSVVRDPIVKDHLKRYSIPIFPESNLKDPNHLELPLLDGKEQPVVSNMGRRHTISEKREDLLKFRSEHHRKDSTHDEAPINRPLYRDDIFFTSSLKKLPQYTSQSSMAYNLSVTRLPTINDLMEEKERKCTLCPEAFRRALATMLDFTLFKSPTFLLLALSGFVTMMGFFVPFMFVPDRATSSGISEETAYLLVSTIGIANTVGRIISGVLSSMPSLNSLLVNNVAITLAGIATVVSGLSMTAEYQFAYATIFGLSISCFSSLRSVLVTELLGLEKLTNAFGLLLLFQGIAACIGSPLAGQFKSITGSYDASFYLSGILILLSAIMCYPLNVVSKWEKKRHQKKNAVNTGE